LTFSEIPAIFLKKQQFRQDLPHFERYIPGGCCPAYQALILMHLGISAANNCERAINQLVPGSGSDTT